MTVCLHCSPTLDVVLGPDSVATAPAERRGIGRDEVRMLVSRGGAVPALEHGLALDLPQVLAPGDLLVVNSSQTLPAQLSGRTRGGEPVAVHLSTVLPSGGRTPAAALVGTESRWIVELRVPAGASSAPSDADRTGTSVSLPGGAALRVTGSHPAGATRSRLWEADLSTPIPLRGYLEQRGVPIRYPYVSGHWPIGDYRTDVGFVPGSAEMPSAGRPLTGRVLSGLADAGIGMARITLHCGVSSLESGEPPYAEWFSVPAATVRSINETHARGGRVIAVGTTVVRALESATVDGALAPAQGWTELVITPDRPVRSVNGLLTGWHEPESSHLMMLEALAGKELLCATYREALDKHYLWHEFGDVNLLLP